MKIKTETQTGSIVSFKYDDEIAEITGLTTSFEPIQDGTPWMSDLNQTPYLLRQSPQYGHDYNSEIDTLIGGSIAWNQLVMNDESTSTEAGIAYTKNSDGSWRVTGTYSARSYKYLSTLNIGGINADDVVYVSSTYKMPANAGLIFDFRSESAYIGGTQVYPNGSYTITKVPSGATVLGRPYININNLSVGTAIDFTVKPIFVNLTRLLGSTIANYVYSLEQSTAGSGIAWLKSYGFLGKDYYAYNNGSLVSVKTSEHRTTGKNQLRNSASTLTTNGITFTVNSDGSVNVNGTATANAFLEMANLYLLQAGTYIVSGSTDSNASIIIRETNAAGTPLAASPSDSPAGSGTSQFTRDGSNTIGVVLRVPSGATLNNVKIYPMIRFADVSDTTFEPYTVHSYPLGNDDLRGIFKLSNGNLYADGDVKTSDGHIQRRYTIVDLGTLNWEYVPNWNGHPVHTVVLSTAKGWGDNVVGNFICPKYTSMSRNQLYALDGSGMSINPSKSIAVRDYAYTSASAFKTAMSGVYLIYELATPTTETADSFASPQIVDPNGTEEYVDTRDVPVPVGHRTTYMLPYPISGWDEVKAYVSPTEEEEDATIYTINLNGTRYGGTIDFFRGVMTLTHGHYAVTGNESGTWSLNNSDAVRQIVYKNMRSYLIGVKETGGREATAMFNLFINADAQTSADVGYAYIENGYLNMVFEPNTFSASDDVKAWLRASDVELVYELATPLEVQLTAEQIEALQGQNNVWCDSGDTTLTWRHIPVLDEAVMLNGKYLELTIDGYSTLGTSGRRSLGRQLDTYSVGTADGETVKNSTFPSRKITVNYVIQTDTEEELTDAINQLANILNQDECDFVFRDEPDKFFSGYGLLDSEPKKYRHAVKGTWSLYCAYPFKRSTELVELSSKDPTVASVESHSATFVFDYKGTLPARPILRAEFASAKSGGEYNEDGDCGYVAFLDAEENIIQLGNPEVLDVDQYANATLINREFTSLSGWTASGVTAGDLTDQFWQNGKGQTQSYAKGTGSLTKSVTGAVDMEFDIVHRLCVSAANQTGKFECYAKNGNNIVVGFKIEKTGNGTAGTVSYILNNKVVGTDSIDLSYYNTHFGYCNRTARYVTQTYSVKETYYVKKKGKKKKKKKTRWVTKTRQMQNGWNYTQSNLNSGWSKDGGVVVFSVGNLADRTFKSSDIELTPSTSVVFGFTGSMHTNAVHSCSMLSKAGVPFAEIPNVFTAGDVVEGDCNSADVMLYRAGSLEGHLEPQYGALGNDWEDFEIKPGKNIIRAVWSDWVNTSYKPEIKIIFNEVYV